MTARQPWVRPDRGAVPVERQLVHADTCPNGAAQDERMAADRAWFDAHPDAQRYTRQISRAEVLELKGLYAANWGRRLRSLAAG